jgi:hypothetical protein
MKKKIQTTNAIARREQEANKLATKREENKAAMLMQCPPSPPPIVEQGEDQEGPWIKFNFKGQPVNRVIDALVKELSMDRQKAIEFYEWHMDQAKG